MADRFVRNCILCGSTASDPQFKYTFNYLVDVMGMSPENARKKGWDIGTESTIVRCSSCQAYYVRDPVLDLVSVPPPVAADREAVIEQYAARVRAHDTYRFYGVNDDEAFNVRNLVFLAGQKMRRDIRFLDFGSGRANASNMARVLGVKDVVAYDPFYAELEMEALRRVSFPGITFAKERDSLGADRRFDAAVFVSAVEHVLDPRGELKTLFDLLEPGGYLYVNNPFMNLERDIGALRDARAIKKGDTLSHYHPWHLNYMTPKQFKKLLGDVGFRVTALAIYPPVPLRPKALLAATKQSAKLIVRTLQNAFGLPYDRYVFVAEKPF